MNHDQLELQAMRALTKQCQAHADAMANELNVLYKSTSDSGSAIYGFKAMVINYWQFREAMGMRADPEMPITGGRQPMTREELEQLAKNDPEVKPHLDNLESKHDQDQRLWLAGWNQVKRGEYARTPAMASLSLTSAEIAELTGKVRYSAQVRALAALRIPASTRANGSPVVARAAAMAALGVPSAANDATNVVLDLDAI